LVDTIDNLGLKTSQNKAASEAYLKDVEFLLRKPDLKTTIDVITPIPREADKLIGSSQPHSYALFPHLKVETITTPLTAFLHNRLVESVGEGSLFKEKIDNAPESLRKDASSYSKVLEFATNEYYPKDNDVSFIDGKKREYTKS
jgi:hypothetical protein